MLEINVRTMDSTLGTRHLLHIVCSDRHQVITAQPVLKGRLHLTFKRCYLWFIKKSKSYLRLVGVITYFHSSYSQIPFFFLFFTWNRRSHSWNHSPEWQAWSGSWTTWSEARRVGSCLGSSSVQLRGRDKKQQGGRQFMEVIKWNIWLVTAGAIDDNRPSRP